jgi:hypothetical protein
VAGEMEAPRRSGGSAGVSFGECHSSFFRFSLSALLLFWLSGGSCVLSSRRIHKQLVKGKASRLQVLAALLSIERRAFVHNVPPCDTHGILRILTQSSADQDDDAVRRSLKISLARASQNRVVNRCSPESCTPPRHWKPSWQVETARETTAPRALCCAVRQKLQICNKTLIPEMLCLEWCIASAQRTTYRSFHVLCRLVCIKAIVRQHNDAYILLSSRADLGLSKPLRILSTSSTHNSLHNQITIIMSANLQGTDGQAPSYNTGHYTFTRYPGTQGRSTVAGRRRAPAPGLQIDTRASHSVRDEELQYTFLRDHMRGKPNVNKPLPPLPGQRPVSRPASPMDRAAHWVNKKVVTPVKEFFKTPKVTEMIPSNSLDRAPEQHTMFPELRSPTDMNRHSRRRPSVDREAAPDRRSASISSRRTFHSNPTTPKSRDWDGSMTGSVRNAFDTAQHVGNRLGFNQSGRLVFSDRAPAGMMDPCSVCHKEPTGVLYHGRCRDCR